MERLRIVVTGLVGLYPVGGVAWDYLQYAIGLARLGHDVYYHEDTWSWPYHPVQRTYLASGDHSAHFIDDFFRRYAPELSGRWHYRHLHAQSFGMSAESFARAAASADIFLNVSGASMLPDELPAQCTSVFVDTDPGYNQIMLSERFDWSENVDRWCASVEAHDRHLTYAESIDEPDCRVPTVGLSWQPTRMPVVLDLWEDLPAAGAGAPWTTVMTWNAFKGPVVYDGIEYRSKDAEFEQILDLPSRISVPLRVAVGGVDAPHDRLRASGWNVIDGPSATLTAEAYRELIAASRGELSTAKHVYVAMRTGWFSCRTACYLAAGRPAVVQDTGFSSHVPTGEGLVAFTTADEAAAAVEAVEREHGRHALAAREVAREAFDSTTVLQDLLEKIAAVRPAKAAR